MLLRLHVWNLSSRNVARYSHRAGAVHDFIAVIVVNILKRIEVIANLPVTSVWIYRFVFVKA